MSKLNTESKIPYAPYTIQEIKYDTPFRVPIHIVITEICSMCLLVTLILYIIAHFHLSIWLVMLDIILCLAIAITIVNMYSVKDGEYKSLRLKKRQ